MNILKRFVLNQDQPKAYIQVEKNIFFYYGELLVSEPDDCPIY